VQVFASTTLRLVVLTVFGAVLIGVLALVSGISGREAFGILCLSAGTGALATFLAGGLEALLERLITARREQIQREKA